jgi:ATP-binding cassette subfamily B protein
MATRERTASGFIALLRRECDLGFLRSLLAALLVGMAGSLLAGLAPLALKALIDAMASRPALGAVTLGPGAAYLGALTGARLMNELRPLWSARAEQRLQARLTERLFAHALALPLALHRARRPGELVHTVHQAAAGVQLILASLISGFVPVAVELTTVVLVLAHLGLPWLVGVFAATASAYLALHASGIARLRLRARAVTAASGQLHARLTEGLLNAETLKVFTAESQAQAGLAAATHAQQAAWHALHGWRAVIGLAATTIVALSVTASLAIAGQAVAEGPLSIGGFVLVTVYMLQIVRPLEMLGNAARNISQGLEFIGPMLALLDQTPEGNPGTADHGAALPGASRPNPVQALGPQVSFRAVSFAYETGQPLLQGLNLDIAAGRSLALVGASGSGKSSLVRLLLRLWSPSAGQVLLDGVDIATLPLRQLRQQIGLVPQDIALLDDSIAANIALGQEGVTRADIEQAARAAALHAFVCTLPQGYDTRVGERGLGLSGGERQRVAIARALLRRPRLLVLDEATSMLDAVTESAVLAQLRRAAAGCTVITIAHRLSAAASADEIAVMHQGRLVERGTHQALLSAQGRYAQLWGTYSACGPRGPRTPGCRH